MMAPIKDSSLLCFYCRVHARNVLFLWVLQVRREVRAVRGGGVQVMCARARDRRNVVGPISFSG